MSPSKSERLRERLSIDPDAPAVVAAPQKAPETTETETTAAAATPAPKGASTRKPAASGTGRARRGGAPKEAAPAATEPQLLKPASTAEAERSTLYLHPDDHRELVMARLEDKADANTRIRAMIALWRANPRYRAAVDKLARTAPRGPGRQ